MFNRYSRTARGALALAVLSIVAVGCSGSSSNSPVSGGGLDTSQPQAGGVLGSTATPAGSPVVVTGHVADKLTVIMLGGAKADLTLVKVADPATVTDATDAAPAGSRWVGLEVTAVDHSPFAAQEQVLVDGIGSDGNTLTTLAIFKGFSHEIGAFAECTWAGSIDPDKSYTMCPAFLLPTGVTLKSVGAKVGGAEIGETTAVDQAIWMVP